MSRKPLQTVLLALALVFLLIASTRTRNTLLGLIGADEAVVAPYRDIRCSLGLKKPDRLEVYFRDGYTRAWRGRGFK